MDDLTQLLNHASDGGRISADQFLPLVYQKLRQVAAEKMAREAAGHTLQATALVHEAWLRVGGEAQGWQNRWHFFSAAAEAMRRILIDRARSKRAERHGGGLERVDVDEVEIAARSRRANCSRCTNRWTSLPMHHPQKAELVKLRYFAGLTIPEAAEVLGISTPTAERHWAIAKCGSSGKSAGERNGERRAQKAFDDSKNEPTEGRGGRVTVGRKIWGRKIGVRRMSKKSCLTQIFLTSRFQEVATSGRRPVVHPADELAGRN